MSEPGEFCFWSEDADGELWATDCAKSFSVIEGTPAENHMRYCCYCGRRLVEVQITLPELGED